MKTAAKPDRLKRVLYPVSFFIVLSAIIFKADTANYNFAFHAVGMIPCGDKIAHAALYGILVYLILYAFEGIGKKALVIAPGAVLAFAAAEEFSQLYFPSRTFDWFDLLADAVGIVGAAAVFWKIRYN